MPFHCGLVTGVVTGFEPSYLAKLLFSAAVQRLPLSVSHSILLVGLPIDLNLFFTAIIIKSPPNTASMPFFNAHMTPYLLIWAT